MNLESVKRNPTVRFTWLVLVRLFDDEGFELSGHLAFVALLALFPFLIFLGALAGVLGNFATGQRFVAFMLQFTPGDISATLSPVVTRIFSSRDTGILTFSALFMLWAASNGIEAMRVVLNRAYRVAETRSFWWRRAQSVVFVALGALAMILLSLAVVLGPLLWRLVTQVVQASAAEAAFWQVARYGIAGTVTFVVLLALHLWLPNTRHRIRDLLPGIVVTVALLLGTASLFSVYLTTVPSYSAVYGSLGGVVVVLVYLYVNALTFIFGGELNSAIWRARAAHRQSVD